MGGRFLQALLLLVGTIIGVGVFAIPFVGSSAGFIPTAIQIALLGALVMFVHLMYGDIVAVTPARHRLPGYVRLYMGAVWGKVSSLSHIIGLTGSLMAYILLGSNFLHLLISAFVPSFSFGFSIALFFITGLVIFYFDSSFSTILEALLTALLVLLLSGLIVLGATHGTYEFLGNLDLTKIPLAYGVILFALSGSVVVPRVYETFARDHSAFKRVLIIGSLLPSILYIGFVFAIFAASKYGISEDAISGLVPLLGEYVLILGASVGFLATITSYIGVGLSQKGLLQFDFGFSKGLAWALTVSAPFILIFLGFSNFIVLIAFVGALGIGFDNIMIVRVWTLLPHHSVLKFRSRLLPWVLGIAFGAGMIYQVIGLVT